jgi:hypothetical protein
LTSAAFAVASTWPYFEIQPQSIHRFVAASSLFNVSAAPGNRPALFFFVQVTLIQAI